MKTEVRGRASEVASGSSQATITDSVEVGSSKRAAEAELDYEVPVEEVYVKALQVKYPIIDWETSAKAKNINGEAQIHAKVDGKKVIISEASIRRDLRFGDKGGVDCFSNEVIFEQLTLMG
nr:hypothetical protein [Tanacetum cinerariifolium]